MRSFLCFLFHHSFLPGSSSLLHFIAVVDDCPLGSPSPFRARLTFLLSPLPQKRLARGFVVSGPRHARRLHRRSLGDRWLVYAQPSDWLQRLLNAHGRHASSQAVDVCIPRCALHVAARSDRTVVIANNSSGDLISRPRPCILSCTSLMLPLPRTLHTLPPPVTIALPRPGIQAALLRPPHFFHPSFLATTVYRRGHPTARPFPPNMSTGSPVPISFSLYPSPYLTTFLQNRRDRS